PGPMASREQRRRRSVCSNSTLDAVHRLCTPNPLALAPGSPAYRPRPLPHLRLQLDRQHQRRMPRVRCSHRGSDKVRGSVQIPNPILGVAKSAALASSLTMPAALGANMRWGLMYTGNKWGCGVGGDFAILDHGMLLILLGEDPSFWHCMTFPFTNRACGFEMSQVQFSL